MKKILLYIQDRQTELSSVVLFAVSVALIVFLLPREAKFPYEFQKGKPWLYENLTAPFDFSVLKTDEEIQEERLDLQSSATIFLDYNDSIGQLARSRFASEYEQAWDIAIEEGKFREKGLFNRKPDLELKEQMKEEGLAILDHIFNTGILKPYENSNSGESSEVLLKRGSLSRTVRLDRFYNIKQAVAYARTGISSEEESEEHAWLFSVVSSNIEYNVFYNESKSMAFLQEQLDNIVPGKGMVLNAELIITKGNIVDDEKYAKLSSLKQTYEGSFTGKKELYLILIGQILLVAILLFVLYLFLYKYRREVIEDISKLTFILVNLLLIVLMASFTISIGVEYIYLAPFTILPIILRSFFDTRIALFVHIIAMLIVGFIVPNSFEFTFLQFVAGIFSIILVDNLYKRAQLFFTASQIIAVYCVSYLSLAIIQEGSLERIELINFGYFAGNGFLTLLSFPLIYFQEKIFGFISDVSLLELSDTNSPLLRELGQKAPGTFQHSLQVANLAEAAVLKINGNALLVRTGALYHDIGKMVSPVYFIENQHTGLNPHDELSFEESAEVIIGHVHEGIKLARKRKLPDMLIDFIRTHHGTSTVMYFYKQYIKNFPEEEVDLAKFTYPGPKPFSKETAVLMMADSVEAASRSLRNPDHESIDGIVEKIIDHQLSTGQFENAEITLREIREVKKIFKKMLMNIYHVRIQYPD